ncbi:adhesion G protein-coupled receptor B1 isoform X5 [Magallana gigas]|uniref:adhesion G protein-coupled receptor B1 isoform X5 n=1 Tax=Magallana gigas TaxID=29159 RepID=UPI00333F9DE8
MRVRISRGKLHKSVICGNCFESQQCHHINGTCMNGCSRGYQGVHCTEECEDYFFGENCEKRCNSTCKNCNKTSGECENGCYPGWTGRFCQEVCTTGFYGEKCSSICGHCLNNSVCDHVTGVCEQGCEPGYQGENCTEVCLWGMYGSNCRVTCGNCFESKQCHYINGTCMNGCGRGYQGVHCIEECDDYFFGENCEKRCNSTCRNCNKSSGECEYGCYPGWTGRFCQEECTAGYYGGLCSSICGHCLNNSTCDHITGVCEQGCEPGYQGEICTEACNGGMYGTNCSVTCGNCFESQQCHHINGTCIDGCDDRYQGLKCIEEILQILQFKSNSLELREGKPAWFELQVLSHSDFKVEWFHDGYMITTSRARFIITSTDMKNATSFHTLQIDRVMQRDTGEWKITVSNEVTYVTRKVTVTVIPELVIKTNPQFDFSVPSGDNIYLQCTVSNPESLYHVTNGRIVFMKNGSLLSVGESYTNFSTIWRKLSATGNDSGRYTCVHSGYDYQVSVSVYINVIQPQQKGCKSEQSDGIIWNTTLAGTTKKEPCPENQIGFVTRYCNSDGIWVSPSFLKCMDEALMIASTELDSIIQDGIQNKEKIQETMNNTLQVMQNLTSSKNEINSGDLSSSLDILEKIVNVTNSTQSIIEKKVFYAVVDNVLSSNNTRSWSIVSKESEKDASSLLKTMERLSDIIIKNHNITTTQFSGSNFELKIDKTNIDQREIRFPDPTSMNISRNLEDPSTFLELPKQGGHAEKAINYVAVIYKTMSDILSSDFHRNDNENEEKTSPKKMEYVNSAVLSLTTQADFGELDPPLNLTFKHVNQIESKRMQVICVSWDFAISKWTERGCKMKQSDHSTTKCQCNHLTNFAILMRPYSANVKDKQSLKTMSLGGVIISILFTVMTLIIYVRIWRYIKSDQNIIMLHLCSSLILSYIIFLSAVELTENENMCIAITAIIHYLFLVTFFSMLGMGVYYFMSITVTYYAMYVANNFKSKSRVRWFLLVIWGFPAVITVTNVGAFWGKDYHLRFYCWLSMESGSLYMFIIPVCLIVVLNIAIIVTLVRVLCASSAISKSSLQKKATSGLRSLGTLIPVLGVTWLFGILAVNEHVDVFQYIFVIANSCQGLFIFISHVVLKKKVRFFFLQEIYFSFGL